MLELLQHTPFLQVDQFLPGPVYADLRSYADRATYDTIENPADGVTYPGICAEIPEPVIDSVTKGLRLIRRGDVTVNYLFLRLSTEGVEAPQVVHSDETMGDYSLMLYMGGNPKGATAFVQHAEYEGDMRAPKTDRDCEVLGRDGRSLDNWREIDRCQFAPNRACIFQADRVHAALPVGGFGHGAADGRLVLTAFFA